MTGIALGLGVLGGVAFGLLPALAIGALFLAWVAATLRRLPVGLVGGVVAAILLGAWRGVPAPDPLPIAFADAARGVAGTVRTIPADAGRNQRFVVEVTAIWTGTERVPATGRIDVSAPARPRVGIGDDVFVTGLVTPVDDHAGGYAAYLRALDCGGSLFGRAVEIDARGDDWRRPVVALRRRIDRLFARAVPGDAGVLLAGFVTGDDHALSRERRDAFVETGTTHLTAVSGSNVALLVAMASFGASGARRRRLGWQLTVLAVIAGYALLVGLTPPAVRAALVAIGAVLAVRVGRRPDFLTLLVVSGALMVVVEPELVWNLSYQLSFAASIGLVAIGEVVRGRPADLVRVAFFATLFAQVATAPLLLHNFATLSLAAIPANLALAPLVAVAFPLAFVAALVGLVAPPVGEAIASVAGILVELMVAIVDWLGGDGRGMLTIDRPGPATTAVLTIMSASVLSLVSQDGRRWLWRTGGDARRSGGRLLVMTGLGLAVALLALAIM